MTSSCFMAVEEAPETVSLPVGRIFVASHAALVSTVLGPGVAVCLWDPIARVGGISHFLHEDEAMTQLIDDMVQRGAHVARMTARVFGGACVTADRIESRGAMNVVVAMQFLAAHCIPVRASQTGGSRERELLFNTGNGHAYVKEI